MGAGVAAALVVGGLGAVGLRLRDGDQGFAVRQLGTDQVTWAAGSELHTPGDSVDLGHEIATYVRTGAGFVFTDPDGTVYSYAAGEVDDVGESDDGRLVSDPQSDWAGWVDSSGGSPQVVVLDVATGQVLRPDGAHELYAVGAGDHAYWRDDRGVRRHEVVPGAGGRAGREGRTSPTPTSGASTCSPRSATRGSRGVAPPSSSTASARGAWEDVPGDRGAFSSSGRFLAITDTTSGSFAVLDTDLQRRVTLDLPGTAATEAVEWLDEQQLVVVVRGRSSLDYQLLTCDVSSGACEPVGDPLEAGFQLPTGEAAGWN